jgi:hypothetical protein
VPDQAGPRSAVGQAQFFANAIDTHTDGCDPVAIGINGRSGHAVDYAF